MVGLAGRFADIRDTTGPLCIGIDPSPESLRLWGLNDDADAALEMARAVISAAAGRVGIVKAQVAFFERFGSVGIAALETVIAEAAASGLCVIADAKRGDIGSTMGGYADAWLRSGPLKSDAMTASPFLGFESLEPACVAANHEEATVFVLCSTSNPESALLQGGRVDGGTVAAYIARAVKQRASGSFSIGLVIGATRPLASAGLSDEMLEGVMILAPGFGAQGASLGDVPAIFGRARSTVIPSVSRSVLQAGPGGVASAIDRHRQELNL
jgi:orotidine-5'-phosphate decarboxylase